MNVKFSGVKRACFPSRFGLLVFTQDGSQGRAISVTDVLSCSMLARFAATRLTAFAQDALNIGCVGALEGKTHVLEGRCRVEAPLRHAESLQCFRTEGSVGLEEPPCGLVAAHAHRGWLLATVAREGLQQLLFVECFSPSSSTWLQEGRARHDEVSVAPPPGRGHVNVQVARTGQLSARFYETAAHRVEVSVRRIVWNRALLVFSDGVFVRAQCRRLAVSNRFVLRVITEELCSAQMTELFVSEEAVLNLIAIVLRIGYAAARCLCPASSRCDTCCPV